MELKNFIVKVAFMGTIACAVPAMAASCSNNSQQNEEAQTEIAKEGKRRWAAHSSDLPAVDLS